MFRRSVQRGAAALAFVLVMTLAGAEPAAAAQRTGVLDRLANAWSAVSVPGGQIFTTLLDRFSGRARWAARNGQDKRGWGIDPNGVAVAVEGEEKPDSPAPTGGN